jgi:capsule biosynthesis phosphatase
MKKIVIDLDDTLTIGASADNYADKKPRTDVVETLRRYQQDGFTIAIATSRNMRTYEGNVGLINVHTLPVIHEWLDKHEIPYDEIIVGKPWCGFEGFYVDDKSIRPAEFVSLSYAEIKTLLANGE